MKKNFRTQIWTKCAKIGPKTRFFLITYNDSLQQFITSSVGKIHEKHFWVQIMAKGTKIGLKTRFCYFLKFSSLVLNFEIACNDSLQQCATSIRGKTHKKIFGTKFGPMRAKIGLGTGFFVVSSSLVC